MSSGGDGEGGEVSCGSRFPIPSSLRKTILDIKEIAAGKHSNDDIYAVLKECNMDPNETVQKLLYLDTFHEVKKKREKRNVNVGQASEEYRLASGMQRQGSRGGRKNYSSSIVSDGRRKVSAREENGNYYAKRHFKPSATFHNKREKNAAPSSSNSSTEPVNDPKNVSRGGFIYEAASHVSFDNPGDAAGVLKPGPTSYPTNTTTILPGIRSKGVPTASESGVYSSASDPVLVPSLNKQNRKMVGTIKRAKQTSNICAESNAFQGKGSLSADQVVLNSGQAASEIMNSASTTASCLPKDVGTNQSFKHLQGFSKTCDGTDDAGYQGGWPRKQVHGPTEVRSQSEAVMVEDTVSLPSKSSVSVPDQSTVELDKKLEKLSVSVHQPVIFPDHLQVPEDLRKGLTFGSLDACLGQSANCELVSTVSTENTSAAILADREPAQSHCYSATEEKGERYNPQPSQPTEFEQLQTSGDHASTTGAEKFDESKQDALAPKGGLPDPLPQTVPEYSFGFVPPVVGSHLLHVEGVEPQGFNSVAPSTSCSSPPLPQPPGLAQSSFAFPPHLLPFVRQPYPPNFIPYNPYFHPLYMPHGPHQFIGHNILPQPPVAANLSVTPTADTKHPVPALYRMGTASGNLTQFGVPSGYGSYGSSAVGYVPSQVSTSCSSAANEDLAAAELKEKTTFSGLKQSEEPQAWSSAPGRDISALPANYFYSVPPGHRVGFSLAHPGHGLFPGVYNLSQTMAGSNVQSLPQQSPATDGSVESVAPTSYLQPHPQFNWSGRMLNRENI